MKILQEVEYHNKDTIEKMKELLVNVVLSSNDVEKDDILYHMHNTESIRFHNYFCNLLIETDSGYTFMTSGNIKKYFDIDTSEIVISRDELGNLGEHFNNIPITHQELLDSSTKVILEHDELCRLIITEYCEDEHPHDLDVHTLPSNYFSKTLFSFYRTESNKTLVVYNGIIIAVMDIKLPNQYLFKPVLETAYYDIVKKASDNNRYDITDVALSDILSFHTCTRWADYK